MLSQIIQTLFPVFALILLGYALAKKRFFTESFLNELNKLVYWVALPAFIVSSLSKTQSFNSDPLILFCIFSVATLLLLGVSFLFSSLKLPLPKQGTFIQGAFRGNLAFVGIPIIAYAFRDKSPAMLEHLLSQTILIFAPTMILYNIIAVLVLLRSQISKDKKSGILVSLKEISKNPLIIATIIGLLLSAPQIPVPSFMTNTLDLISKIAAPCALLCAGGGIAHSQIARQWKNCLICSVLKTFILPLILYIICLPLDISDDFMLILLILAAAPTAIASYVLTKTMNGDTELCSGTIVLSTLLSPISLSIIIALTH